MLHGALGALIGAAISLAFVGVWMFVKVKRLENTPVTRHLITIGIRSELRTFGAELITAAVLLVMAFVFWGIALL